MKSFDCSIRVFESSIRVDYINPFHSFQPNSKKYNISARSEGELAPLSRLKGRFHPLAPLITAYVTQMVSWDQGGGGFHPLAPLFTAYVTQMVSWDQELWNEP